MEGDIGMLLISDLLQMICLGGYSRDVHLFDGAVQLGVIAIRNGRIERCFGFGTWGEAAFFKLVSVRRGRYKVNEAHDRSGADAALTEYSWQELLMEAMRRQDEAEHLAQAATAAGTGTGTGTGRVIAFPSPPGHATAFDVAALATVAPVAVTPPPIAAPAVAATAPAPVALPAATPPPASAPPDISELLAEATACYLRRDVGRAQALLEQCLALAPGDRRVLQNLDRIRRKNSP